MFINLEKDNLLDRDSSFKLYILHYMFLQRINEILLQFINSWNHHKISKEKNKSINILKHHYQQLMKMM